MGLCVGSLFCGYALGALSSLPIILLRERERCLLYFNCVVAVCVLCVFLMVPWVGLQSVIVVFPGHTHPRGVVFPVILAYIWT